MDSEVGAYARAIGRLAEVLRPLIEFLKERGWDPVKDGHLMLVRHMATVRQFDALEAARAMTTAGNGFAAPPLLRSACEEVIVLKYLHTLDWSEAEQIVASLLVRELAANTDVQRRWFAEVGFDANAALRGMGISEEIERDIEQAARTAAVKLASLDKKLGWNRNKWQDLPSTRFMAEKIGSAGLYEFVFHATSRFVHYSGVELYRRSWQTAEDGGASGSHQMAGYWGDFALYWLSNLLMQTVELVVTHDFEELPEFVIDLDALNEGSEAKSELTFVPLILASDLGVEPDLTV